MTLWQTKRDKAHRVRIFRTQMPLIHLWRAARLRMADESTYGMGRWWLRSPLSNEVYLVRYVDGFGDAKESFSAEYRLGIVPAIHYLP